MSPDPERKDLPANGDDAHERLQGYLHRLQDSAPRTGLGATTGAFVDHVVGVAERYGRSLFHCFDDPLIPSTSNSLEGFFGVSKGQLRGALAAASTANGVAQNLGPDYLESLAFTRSHSHRDLLVALESVSAADYQAARDLVEENERPARLRRSRRRNSNRHLELWLARWHAEP